MCRPANGQFTALQQGHSFARHRLIGMFHDKTIFIYWLLLTLNPLAVGLMVKLCKAAMRCSTFAKESVFRMLPEKPYHLMLLCCNEWVHHTLWRSIPALLAVAAGRR